MPVTRFATRLLQSLRSQRRHNRRRNRLAQQHHAAVEIMEPRQLLTIIADLNPDVDANFTGTRHRDTFKAGSGTQQIVANAGNDRIVSLGDAGEPDPAQTNGADGRVNPPVADGTANDIFYGGLGADVFEFRPLLNATQEVRDQYTSRDRGNVNWQRVAGENDDVHAHWVEGIGDDIVMDFSRAQGDRFEVNGHTATLRSITYGEDEIGTFSLVTIYSQQGDGANGGANTAAGAHDEDPLGTIRVYGDKVNKDDITFNAGVFYGIEQLNEADRLAESNGGGRREVIMGADGDSFVGTGRVNDRVTAGLGSQNVDLGGGSYDVIYVLGDAGEPDPAQTDGADGRINPPVDPALADDVVMLGQGKDIVEFRPLLNARPDVLAKHTRSDGSINWRGVAGENNDVHAHWVEGIGDDVVLNYSQADGDQLRVYGHTATLQSIEYGEDELGDFSLVTIYSEQGNAGAHDDDPLGTFKVYGDVVTEDDIQFRAHVFYGVDQLTTAAALDNSELREAGLFGTPSKFFTEPVRDFNHEAEYEGSRFRDHFVIGSGNQTVYALAGNDRIYSLGDAGEPDPAQTEGGAGRVDPPVPDGRANDTLVGGLGADTFEFRPLLNATTQVKDQFRSSHNGLVNWRRVAGENDNVHEHWVEGIGHDRILDYNEAEGDQIKISGHTATLRSITYGEDEIGTFSLITIFSQQGDGANGGANTAAGAHDEDPLGTIRVYGDKVTADDLTINAGVFYGMDALDEANRRADHNANGRRVFASAVDNDEYAVMGNVADYVTLGRGSQTVDTTAGNDTIYVLGDAGEPDPAQTDGADGRVTPPVDPELANDVIRAGQGRDTIIFRPLLNAKTEVLQKHLRSNGTINWRGVAGENDNVHNHWVEGIGDDILLDFSLADGDRIRVEGHTATLGSIEYGEDAMGDFSLVTIYSEQGNAGAHDDDPLGTIRIYGDKVTEDDITFKPKVFYGVDALLTLEGISTVSLVEGAQGALLNAEVDANMTGSRSGDRFRVGSGRQQVVAGAGDDRIISVGDAGEPDPAQTNGADGRVNPPVADGTANDIFYGGLGADVFEFRPLLNATQEVRDQYTSRDRGNVNWQRVAGENDDVHAHWVEGIGDDIVMDFSRAQGDRFEVNGHTATLRSITYGEDEIGTFSLVTIYSQQGDGANGGANTAAGAHDEDPLGTIRVYGDKVNKDDITFNAGVFYGIEQLNEADRLAESNGGGRREVIMGGDGDSFVGTGRVNDRVTAGLGSQNVDLGGGSYDVIYLLGDAGEPDPAQTDGDDGRINPPVDPALADDVVMLGQGKDIVEFRPLLNARPDVLAKHTRSDGSINWRGVAGENNDVHAHWVEGIGDDVVLNYSQADGDQLRVYGHTATLQSIEYGEDELGDFSLVTIYSEQGNAGAHDDDPLGTFKVYGDVVTEDDIQFRAHVFYGVDQLSTAAALDNSELREAGLFGTPSKFFTEPVRDFNHEAEYEGSRFRDHFVIGSGNQTVYALAGNDRIYSLGDAGEPDPAQTEGGAGRVDPPVPDGRANDTLVGGLGADTFEFRPLLNATTQVKDQFRSSHNGLVNWRRVAGENDNVHEHWVEGIGHDRILDYNEAEGDQIKISGHTATLRSITYGEDEIGTFSLITIFSQQGDGANGGANTAAGAHDEDPLGTIRVYGDKVTADDLTINAGVFYGMDALDEANRRADHNANGQRVFASAVDNDEYAVMGNVSDYVTLGRGSQTVDTTAGNDTIYVLGDAGEPDPAQTDGADGRVTPPVDPELANDVIRAGQGRDTIVFRPLLNAKTEVLQKHLRSNGTINWRGVAGENDNVHNHWVEGIGDDILLDFSLADGDRIRVEGHTATLGSIEYGEDAMGDFSLVTIYSEQGNAGAHDDDPLGTIRIYGDKVTEDDITFKAHVFYGIDMLNTLEGISNEEYIRSRQDNYPDDDEDDNGLF